MGGNVDEHGNRRAGSSLPGIHPGVLGKTLPLALCALVALGGCGGGAPRQDADEPRGEWSVDVVEASFPRSQRVSEQTRMTIRVRNEERSRAIPNLAVTVEGFGERSAQVGLSDPNRPVWILDRPPVGGTTAYTNTWALGRVPPGGEREFSWRVTPVKPGRRTLRYRVSAGLDGKAVAKLEGGGTPAGTFRVDISGEPSQSRVDPETGAVVRE
jgi:hypothetical protein